MTLFWCYVFMCTFLLNIYYFLFTNDWMRSLGTHKSRFQKKRKKYQNLNSRQVTQRHHFLFSVLRGDTFLMLCVHVHISVKFSLLFIYKRQNALTWGTQKSVSKKTEKIPKSKITASDPETSFLIFSSSRWHFSDAMCSCAHFC